MVQNQLQARSITSGYDKRIIIDGLDITIPSGKISVIIGANGSGKSTLLKTFCKLLKPDTGKIVLNQQDIQKIPPKQLAKQIGLLPQSPIVPEGVSVSQLVSRGRFPYREPLKNLSKKDYEAIEEAMTVMNICDLSESFVDELSGGQRQRVWIALALAQESDILFLDEPTTFLDIAFQIEILDLLYEINRKKKKTIVMVLHDINLSVRYADYIFAMSKGKLIAKGNPKEIINAKLIKDVYGLTCKVIEDPISNSPLILPISKHHI